VRHLFCARPLVNSFKPRPGLPAAERAVVDQRHLPRLRQLEIMLSVGPDRLREVVNQYDSRRRALMSQIQTVVDQFAQAESDVEVMIRIGVEGRRVEGASVRTQLIRCPSCGVTNRVPLGKAECGLTPVCGYCKTRLTVHQSR